MSGCKCDFCTGVKDWDDNWCPRCGDVRLSPPKRWVDMDVCDACEKAMEPEEAAMYMGQAIYAAARIGHGPQ